jgi:polysaccharide deacetylase family protein (PEP-CTERM system associated)
LIYNQSQTEFKADLTKAKAILESIVREPVLGYRAPSFSITKTSLWALDILAEKGFKYDSSLFPAYRDKGGFVGAERYPHKMHNGGNSIWEFPISTIRAFSQNFPFSGGGYFRLFPYCFTRWAISRINNEGHPVNVYVHPWELDPEQPKIKSGHLSSFRHYVNIAKTEEKLKQLLEDFKFTSIRNVLANGDAHD